MMGASACYRIKVTLAGLLGFLCVWVFVPNQSALAHAALLASDPADGAVLEVAPDEAVLTFSEVVDPLVLTLVTPDGTSTTLRGVVHGMRLVVELPRDPGHGTFTLNWRVISADGHPVGGSIVYSLGTPSSAIPSLVGTDGTTVPELVWIARVGMYLGLFVGVGGTFFFAWTGRGTAAARAVVVVALLVGSAAAPLGLGLLGLDALGASLADLILLRTWLVAGSTSAGLATLCSGVAVLSGALALLTRSATVARWLSLAAMLLVGTSLASTGHAANASPWWLARPAVFLHGIAVAWWLGALVPLAGSLRKGNHDASDTLRRFSRAAPWVVAVLVATGTVLGVLQVQEPARLLTAGYGEVLLLKLGLVALMLWIAAVNRWRLTKRFGEPGVARNLARLILFEIVVGIAILGLVALWRFTPPPRSLAVSTAIGSVHIHTARAMADLSFVREGDGLVGAEVQLLTGDLGLLEAKEVSLVMSSLNLGIEGIRRQTRRTSEGGWVTSGLPLTPGAWHARIDVLVSDFELVTLDAELQIGR